MKASVMEDVPSENPSVPEPSGRHAQRERRVEEIISRGRRAPEGRASVFTLSLFSGLLLWAAFPPLDWGPLAWISLIPLLALVRPEQRVRWMYRLVWLASFVYWLATLQWMRLGDPTMYLALVALAAYLAFYWPLFLALCRTAVHRMRIPLVVCAPLMWVGLEYARAHVITGFSWYYLGHTQHRWVDIIQVSDLFGGYAVSFVIVAANAALVAFLPDRLWSRWHLRGKADTSALAIIWPRWALAFALLLVVGSWGYGKIRRWGLEFPAGPRVALIQGDFPASIRPDHDQWTEIFMTHFRITGEVMSSGLQPDLIVWPEAMFRYPLYEYQQGMSEEQLRDVNEQIDPDRWTARVEQAKLQEIAEYTNASLIVGASVYEATPESFSLYNSALFVQPGVGIVNRFDKIHRVPFGEYIPLTKVVPWLQALTPFRGKFGIDAGTTAKTFRDGDWRLVPTICFEDTVPQLVRSIAASANVNGEPGKHVLVNLSNDGWFHGSSELDQHLITSAFRAVETRTPMVRAVNTGISAVIDGDGVVRDPLLFIDHDAYQSREPERPYRTARGGFQKQINAAVIADVPMDPRSSLYVMMGDWFAAGCLGACLAAAVQGLWRRKSSTAKNPAATSAA